MAELQSTLGPLSGTIGNITLRRRNGKTIAAQKRGKATKPPTFGTALQRVRFGHMASVFSALNNCANGKAMHHAFPNRPDGSSNFNEFMSRNLSRSEVKAIAVTKTMNSDNFIVPAPFIVSKGSLTPPTDFINLFASGKITLTGTHNFTTLGDLSATLISDYGFKDGDIITFFVLTWEATGTSSAKFHSLQMIVKANSTDALPDFVSAAGVFTLGNATSSVAVVRGRNSAEGYEVSDAQFGNQMLTATVYTTYTGNTAETAAAESMGYVGDPYLQDSDPLH